MFLFGARLGKGAYGDVYLATMTEPDGSEQQVAVKLLHEGLDASSQAVERLRDEAQMLAHLRHPSIPQVHQLLQVGAQAALVAEYVEGVDLGWLMQRGLKPKAVLEAVGQVARALSHAHTSPAPDGSGPMRLVHRDVKPANIRVGSDGRARLLDFGTARADNVAREAHTDADALMGSKNYMAPEALVSQEVTDRADVHALAIVLYEGLSGHKLHNNQPLVQRVYHAGTAARFQASIRSALSRIPRDVAPDVHTLITDAMSWAPEDRPSARRFAETCERAAARHPGRSLAASMGRVKPSASSLGPGPMTGTRHAVQLAPPPEAPRTRSRRPLLTWILAAGGVLLAVGALALLTSGGVALIAAVQLTEGAPQQEPVPRAAPDAPDLPAAPVPAHLQPVLVARGGERFAPEDAPAGRYRIEADFGDGPQDAGEGVVRAGMPPEVYCSRAERTCVLLDGS